MQDYVNEHQIILTKTLLEALPAKLREILLTTVQWVSPLANEDYAEYRDGDFLHAIGLGEFTMGSGELSGWPLGSSWDGLHWFFRLHSLIAAQQLSLSKPRVMCLKSMEVAVRQARLLWF